MGCLSWKYLASTLTKDQTEHKPVTVPAALWALTAGMGGASSTDSRKGRSLTTHSEFLPKGLFQV